MMAQWEQQQQTDGMPMTLQGRSAIRRGTTKRAVGTMPTATERAGAEKILIKSILIF